MAELPPGLIHALTLWANENDLTPCEAAADVREALRPLGEVWVVSDRDLYLLETTYRAGHITVRTATLISRSGITPLEWRTVIHPSGTIHHNGCDCTDYEEQRISVGQTIEIGDWTWTGLATGLNGFRLTTGE